MLNSVQHLTKSRPYEILKQVQDDKTRHFTRPSFFTCKIFLEEKNAFRTLSMFSIETSKGSKVEQPVKLDRYIV
jgi:hypothetical protein